jgi:hypothetical protein
MERRTTTRGTKKCRNFASLAEFSDTMLVISTALEGRYCALTHHRNGYLTFVNRLPDVQ